MASRKTTPDEEIFLIWLFMKNLQEVRGDKARINWMFETQRAIRARIGWSYSSRSRWQMMEEVAGMIDVLGERYAFSSGPGDPDSDDR